MHLYDLINRDDLERGISEKLINIREAHDGQRIYNYSDAALFTPGAWDNPAVRQCRGLITDPDGNVIARPWAKFFNHGQVEAGALDLDAPVEVTDKMDGSLGVIHVDHSGSLRVATRGSFESEQAFHATDWLTEREWRLVHVDKVTPLVEIIYPGNRIVCDYGDRDELVLLGGVNIETGDYHGPSEVGKEVGWPGAVADDFPYGTLRDALAAPPRPGAEGLCVRYLSEPRIVKIKQDDYVALHRIVTGLSERTVWQHIIDGNELGYLLGPLPDELHTWTRSVWDRIHSEALAIAGRAMDAHAYHLQRLPEGWTRGDYAVCAKAEKGLTPYMFNLLDGRNPMPSILRTLKPAGDTRARPTSEATA